MKTQSKTDNQEKENIFQRLQEKWGVTLWQTILILITFSVTGMTVVYLRKWLFSALGYTDDTPMWLKTITYLFFVFPSYQILILVYGSALGQFQFFWNKEKKLYYAVKRLFNRKN